MANYIERDIYVLRDITSVARPIEYVQSTNALDIMFVFKDYDIPSEAVAKVYVHRPSTKGEYDTATIDGNKVIIDVKDTMFAEIGKNQLQVSIANGEDTLVTFSYPVLVKRNYVPGITDPSRNTSDFLDEYVKKLGEDVENKMDKENPKGSGSSMFGDGLIDAQLNELDSQINEHAYPSVNVNNCNYKSTVDGRNYNFCIPYESAIVEEGFCIGTGTMVFMYGAGSQAQHNVEALFDKENSILYFYVTSDFNLTSFSVYEYNLNFTHKHSSLYRASSVRGKYNEVTSAELLEVVGNGTDENNRSNAYELYKDGTAKFGGDVIAEKDGEQISLVALSQEKMNKQNPVFTGSFSLNRKADTTVGEYSVALGENCEASGDNSFAVGKNAMARGYESFSMGNTLASGDRSFAFGSSSASGTQATGVNSFAFGHDSRATGDISVAFGTNVQASGLCSFAQGGSGTTASGDYSFAGGYSAKASGDESFAFGHSSAGGTESKGFSSFAFGLDAKAEGDSSVAIGQRVSAIGRYSHAEGEVSTANGNYSFAFGNWSNASGNNSVAFSGAEASGYSSFAVGSEAVASGDNSLGVGYHSYAKGSGAIAFGDSGSAVGIQANGHNSFAHGSNLYANGDYSFAHGTGANAYGRYSFAKGTGIESHGDFSCAMGEDLRAHGNYQHVQGRGNVPDTDSDGNALHRYAHIVGNGIPWDYDSRSNAHTLDWGGNAWYQGNVYVGGTGQDNVTYISRLVTDKDMTPIILSEEDAEEYLNDSLVGDEVLGAIMTGRQILVKVHNADGGTSTGIYSPVYQYQLPKTANGYLYLFYLKDEKQDLSAVIPGLMMPMYGQLKLQLSEEYNYCPLEQDLMRYCTLEWSYDEATIDVNVGSPATPSSVPVKTAKYGTYLKRVYVKKSNGSMPNVTLYHADGSLRANIVLSQDENGYYFNFMLNEDVHIVIL